MARNKLKSQLLAGSLNRLFTIDVVREFRQQMEKDLDEPAYTRAGRPITNNVVYHLCEVRGVVIPFSAQRILSNE